MNHEQMLRYHQNRVQWMIREISALYGGDDEEFLNAYIADVLKEWSNRMGECVTCFEQLHKQALLMGSKKVERVRERPQPRGHGAFRDFYDKVGKAAK